MNVVKMSLAVIVLALAGAGAAGAQSNNNNKNRNQDMAAINVQLGVAYLKQGNLAIAQEKLERAEKQNPRDPNVHTALAVLYERLNRPRDVETHYRTATRLAPRDPNVANNYAVWLCKNGRTEDGVKRFIEAARNPLYSTPETAYTNAGVCLRAAKKPDQAAELFQLALQTRPNLAEAAYQISELQFERGKYSESRANLDRFLGAFKPTPDLLLLGVRVARATGDRLGEEKFARTLRVEFPQSEQVRALAELKRNPG
jgi:type IV pilus assembly protein PilF